MIIRFSKEFVEANPFIYDSIKSSFWHRPVFYVLDWRYRKSVELSPWLKNQVDNPTEQMRIVADSIATGKDYDETMLNILKWVSKNVIYKTDKILWGVEENWEEGSVVLQNRKGDCESGGLLMYLLARLKGVPANRVYLMAGDVDGGGHAWLAYRSIEYPLNWFFLDWCYWVNTKDFSDRPVFFVRGKDIFGENLMGGSPIGPYVKYRRMWFVFNEDVSHPTLHLDIDLVR